MAVILVGGGARSGKSRHALTLARACSGPRLFVAAARLLDEEMRLRSRMHQAERGSDFDTVEEPIGIQRVLETSQFAVAVVDCLTLWLSNVMLEGDRDIERETENLVRTAAAASAPVILVTNEVGCGIVPENVLAREFRDHAGRLNQRAAAAADEVYWLVFGCPLRVK
ncbi:MAG: bifunctional adenosylcobinamide kinase/adenosylcobinamide-phosphate guanylyltransferase [Bryobacteraceae bacterium]